MHRKTIHYNNYKLHLINTKKFKTITFKIIFKSRINKEEITIRNLLTDNLVMSTEKYPSVKKMGIKEQDLYGAYLRSSTKRTGNYSISEITMSILNPIYTEKEMLEESLSLFHDVIFKPNVKNKEFNKEIFDILKNDLKSDILANNDNPKALSLIKLKESMGDYPFAYNMDGNIEDLEKITTKDLYEYFENFYKNNIIDFYVVGDISSYNIEKIIKEKFIFNTENNKKINADIDYKNTKNEIKEIIEETNFKQTNLSISCSINNINDFEREFVVTLYNIILGSSPCSKLFTNVREKNSLAYSISSYFRRSDSILIILAGISMGKYNETINEIKKSMEEIEKGQITEKELKDAKKLFITAMEEINEYPESIINYYHSIDYFNAVPIKETKKAINSITKEDIIKVANKIVIDTIYTLKEGAHEED